MKYNYIEGAKNILTDYCNKNSLNLITVGSVAYAKGLETSKCDDLDCIIVYNFIDELKNSSFLNKTFLKSCKTALKNKEIDLFATKFKILNIPISLDFVSLDYLDNICSIPINNSSIYFKKMTDAEEKPLNYYYGLNGELFTYKKIKENKEGYNVYTLPKHMYINGIFYTGVLMNKLIECPDISQVNNQQITKNLDLLMNNLKNFYIFQKKSNPSLDIINCLKRNWERYSEHNKHTILNFFNN